MFIIQEIAMYQSEEALSQSHGKMHEVIKFEDNHNQLQSPCAFCPDIHFQLLVLPQLEIESEQIQCLEPNAKKNSININIAKMVTRSFICTENYHLF